MDYPEIDQHGELVCIRAGSNHAMMLQSVGDGNSLLIEMPPSEPSWWDDQALAWVAKPEQPSPWHEWDRSAKVWADPRSLGELRAARWAEIKRARAEAEVAPLVASGLTFDADAESQRRIAGAVQLAVIAPAGWSLDWTLADNTVATLTAAQIVAVGVALGTQVSAAHATARILRERIAEATNADELNAITWPTA